MRYGDLLAKLASGQQLSPEEQGELRLQGNRQEDAASQISGGDISTPYIAAAEAYFDFLPLGACSVIGPPSSQALSSGVQSPLQFSAGVFSQPSAFTWSSGDPTKITWFGSPAEHMYLFSGCVTFSANSSGYRTVVLASYNASDVLLTGITLAQTPCVTTALKETIVPFSAVWRKQKSEAYMQLEALQDGGTVYATYFRFGALRVF